MLCWSCLAAGAAALSSVVLRERSIGEGGEDRVCVHQGNWPFQNQGVHLPSADCTPVFFFIRFIHRHLVIVTCDYRHLLQMAAAFYQVLVALKPTFDLTYPDNFESLMSVFAIVDLDWDKFFYPQGGLSACGTNPCSDFYVHG